MSTKIKPLSLTLLLLLTLAVGLGYMTELWAADAATEVAIIVHKDAKEDTLKKVDIENIFLGKKTKWLDDSAISFVVMEEGDIHKAFLKDYVGKTESQFNSYWKNQVFTGKGKSPTSFKNDADLLNHVAKTAGAIGYVSKATLEANKDKVKAISVK